MMSDQSGTAVYHSAAPYQEKGAAAGKARLRLNSEFGWIQPESGMTELRESKGHKT